MSLYLCEKNIFRICLPTSPFIGDGYWTKSFPFIVVSTLVLVVFEGVEINSWYINLIHTRPLGLPLNTWEVTGGCFCFGDSISLSMKT